MCRTIVGVSANLCPVDPEGKNLHSSVSSQFAEGIRQAGGLPMVIPMGDPSLVKDYVETIDKLILSGGQNVDPSLYGEEKTIEAIEAVDGHRIMGLQWHPEYLVNEEKGNLELFRYLLQEL